MKATLVLQLCAALLATGGSLWAQDNTKRTFGNGVLPEYLAVYDVDDNGALSIEEAQALRADRANGGRIDTFRRKWDSNHDGTISPAEREAARAVIRQLIIDRRCRRFDEVDANEDGFLSQTEFNAIGAVQSVDGTSPGTATSIFAHLDKDDDNRVSKAEFLRSLDAAPAQVMGVQPPPHPDSRPNTP